MANEYNSEYGRRRSGRGYYDEPYERSSTRGYNRPEYRNTSYYDEPQYGEYGYSNEPYRVRYGGVGYGGYYNEPYSASDYGRYEYGDRSGESFNRRNYEGRNREAYNRGQYDRSGERGILERAGDEVKSWFGDEEAERRRRMDHWRNESHVGRGPRNYRRSDERIREDINDRLTDDWLVDASDIEVTVNNSVVTLSGRVDNRDEKRRAEEIAEEVKGVTDVTNQLRVGQAQFTTTATETSTATTSRTAKS